MCGNKRLVKHLRYLSKLISQKSMEPRYDYDSGDAEFYENRKPKRAKAIPFNLKGNTDDSWSSSCSSSDNEKDKQLGFTDIEVRRWFVFPYTVCPHTYTHFLSNLVKIFFSNLNSLLEDDMFRSMVQELFFKLRELYANRKKLCLKDFDCEQFNLFSKFVWELVKAFSKTNKFFPDNVAMFYRIIFEEWDSCTGTNACKKKRHKDFEHFKQRENGSVYYFYP